MNISGINLSGKKGLIVGVANDHSIAWGCAKILHQGGAMSALTYLNEKAKPHVQPLAEAIDCPIFMPLDVTNSEQTAALFQVIKERWRRLDYIIHSVAFAPKEDLHGRVIDASLDGFLQATDVSCHSFIRLAQLAEPLMIEGGSMITMSYYGAEKVVPNYGIMGPIKAMLETIVRYMAAELGEKNIRVNAISPGALMTRAASGIKDFDQLMKQNDEKSPLKEHITVEDVGNLASFLVSDLSQNITGGVHFVDAGYEIID